MSPDTIVLCTHQCAACTTVGKDHFLVFAHRVLTAFRAISERRFFESFLALALPPMLANRRAASFSSIENNLAISITDKFKRFTQSITLKNEIIDHVAGTSRVVVELYSVYCCVEHLFHFGGIFRAPAFLNGFNETDDLADNAAGDGISRPMPHPNRAHAIKSDPEASIQPHPREARTSIGHQPTKTRFLGGVQLHCEGFQAKPSSIHDSYNSDPLIILSTEIANSLPKLA